MSGVQATGNADWLARSRAAVWHPCTQMKVHETLPLVPIERGRGAWLYDFDGRRYLDAVSSWWVNLFGHAEPRIGAAIAAQLDTIEHVMLAGLTHRPVVELSERLAALAPPGLGHSFYASDGAAAVEIALKMAAHAFRNRGEPQRTGFVSLAGSYHGETLGALAVTDVALFRDAYGPLLMQNAVVASPADVRDGESLRDAAVRSAAALDAHLARHAATTAALIVEPLVQGAAGMAMYDPHYLALAREITTRHGVLLIADEIMTGFGRTGKWFGMDHWGVVPDIMTLAKGINSGSVPLGATVVRPWLAEKFETQPYLHGHTYSGHVLAMAAAVATIEAYQQDKLIDQAAKTGAYLMQKLKELQDKHPSVGEVRGKGLFCGIEIVKNRQTKEPIHEALMEPPRPATSKMKFLGKCMEDGVYILAGGASVIMICPPLTITTEELDFGLDVIDRNLTICDADYQR
jgi:adenosylmethionine---8-amino-7-oxononanoate aminotransferase